MACFPGLDVFGATESGPPTIFDSFFPIPCNIGDMHSDGDFRITSRWILKAQLQFLKGYDVKNKERGISLVIHNETQNYDAELKDVLQEIRIISDLDHDNVLKFYEPISGNNLTDIAFLFEPVGRLLSQIIADDIPQFYEPPVIKSLMRGLFTALSYLHQKRIIHRDIQPENIAFSSTGVLKVWNFRSARKFGQKPENLRISEFRYQPVELLMVSEKYDETVDIWAANCIFAQLWLRKSLFPEHGREKVLTAIFKLLGFPNQEIWGEFFSIPGVNDLLTFGRYLKYNRIDQYFKKYCDRLVSPYAMDLMHHCFSYNPNYRPSAEKCLEHGYFHEEPEACPVADISHILARAVVCEQIRKIRIQNNS